MRRFARCFAVYHVQKDGIDVAFACEDDNSDVIECSTAEEFKSDDKVKVSTKTKDAEATEEVYIFWKNRTNFDRELLGS